MNSYPASGSSGTVTPIARVSMSGAITKTRATLPKIASASSPGYEVTAPNSNGTLAAVELGDHTDICGVGPSSTIYVANTITGQVTIQGPPAPKGANLRVNLLAWSPSGVLDATMLYCPASWSRALQTELWENAGHGWHEIGTDVLSAARGPHNILATVTGYIGLNSSINHPSPIPAGPQELYVGDTHIPLRSPADQIAWSPS
jgi:hypothetical protein